MYPRTLFGAILAVAAIASMSSCARHNGWQDTVNVMPQPQEVRLTGGTCDAAACVRKDIVDKTLGEEEYTISIKNGELAVKASSERGFFYAGQTLRQLAGSDGRYPNVEIRDWPRFGYRGLHLDCSRHFFSVREVKRYLDIMALHKLNVLHWHLTDDQGWRIEIDSWPRLTEVGAWRVGNRLGRGGTDVHPDGETYGGYYTKAQLRDIVHYADSLGISIMPEIDLPGHMLAALASYPELGCTGGPYEVSGYSGISQDVLCAGNEKTYEFIEDVLSEVLEIFPYEFIHIGGDECPKTRWETCPKCQAKIKELGLAANGGRSSEALLQGYVTSRVGEFLEKHGRRLVGWDEIMDGDIPTNSVIMSWRDSEHGIKASAQGHNVIMTPTREMYLDYCQSETPENEPDGIGGYLPIWKVYGYEPFIPGMTEEQKSHFLGVQANLWTEFISTDDHLEYMFLPRLAALSEVQWCEPERKSFDRFMKDLGRMVRLYADLGYNCAQHVFGVIGLPRPKEDGVEFSLYTAGDAKIRYTLDGSEPGPDSKLYEAPFTVSESPATVKAAVWRDGQRSQIYSCDVLANKAYLKPVTVGTEKAYGYTWQTEDALVDGLIGTSNFCTESYVSWCGEPMQVTLDLGEKPCEYSSVTLSILVDRLNYIFSPSSVEISLSDDGKEFRQAASVEIDAARQDNSDGHQEINLKFDRCSSRYIRIDAEEVFPIPDWHPGRGQHSFMFVDEIIVE